MRILSLILIAVISEAAFAQSSARFKVVRSVVAGGGEIFRASSRFQLNSTIGQPIASALGSGRFSIQSGFWIWDAPAIFAPSKVGDTFSVSFPTEPGREYTLQHSDSLADPAWQSLPVIAGDGLVKTITHSAPGVMQRFFRLFER